MVTNVHPANTNSHGTLLAESISFNVGRITIIGMSLSFVNMIFGNNNSFHLLRNCSIAKAPIAGTDTGSITERKIKKSLAPSILAASIKEFGMVIMYCLIRNRANTLAIPGKICTL
jgi:hypothetical protein